MIDLFFRTLLHPLDYLKAAQEHTLVLKNKINEGNNVYTFVFESAKQFQWKAGQHAIFRIPDKNISGKKWRAFSIASACSEGEIRISTVIKENPSSFKSALQSLTFGSCVIINGPFGEFHIRGNTHLLGIASGVGITPFRAIAKELEINPKISLTLLYISRNGDHIYKNEFEELNRKLNFDVNFFNDEGEAISHLRTIAKLSKNKLAYYISGSPKFINGTKHLLKKLKIKRIVNDPFKGY